MLDQRDHHGKAMATTINIKHMIRRSFNNPNNLASFAAGFFPTSDVEFFSIAKTALEPWRGAQCKTTFMRRRSWRHPRGQMTAPNVVAVDFFFWI